MSEITTLTKVRLSSLTSASILIISVLKGIRYPGPWAYTHYLFNYDFGFTKRGLIGAIINSFAIPYLKSYEFFTILSLILLIVNISLIYLFFRDLSISNNTTLIWCTFVFASSLAVVFLSHTVGYFEHLGLLTALITIRLKGFYRKLLFLVPAFTIALLAHEANLILFFPVIFLSLLFSIPSKSNVWELIILGSFSAIVIGLAIIISKSGLERKDASQMYNDLQAEVGKESLRKDAFEVLFISPRNNSKELYKMWSSKPMASEMLQSFLVTLPPILIFIFFTNSILKKSGTKTPIIVLSILASISPFVLHFLAWDINRWNTLTITTSFLVLCTVYTSDKTSGDSLPDKYYHVLILVMFLNSTATITLFDGYTVQEFPFKSAQKYISDLLTKRITFP